MSTLNHRQRLFVHYYLGDAKDNAVKAAKMAGYANPESAAFQLLKSRVISGYLEQKLEESGAMPVAEVLARLSTIASLDVMEFVEFVEDVDARGNVKLDSSGEPIEKPVLDLKKVKKLKKGNLIKDLKIHPSGAIEVKFHDAAEAMDKLAKYHGMFVQRIEIDHLNGDAATDRVLTLLGGLTQLAGAIQPREAYSEPEPRALCTSFERISVEAGETSSLLDAEDDGCGGGPDQTINCDGATEARESLSPEHPDPDAFRLDDDRGTEAGRSGL
ncbi:MAG: terminase small subunit [Candidatus Pacebacteria bacterium]|nr:terminase small subunit [Candidatus Paceibacterota bacterium]